MKYLKRWLGALLMALPVVSLFSCKEATQSIEVVSYDLMSVDPQSCEITQRYSASVGGHLDVTIYPQVSGVITKLLIDEGEQVKKGQTLFVIDQVPYKAAVAMAEANVKAAEAAVATAELTYKSKQALYDKKVVSQFDLSTAENAYLTAKAQLAQAEAQLLNAQNNLTYTTVKSPVDGVAGVLPYPPGSLVGPNLPTPLTTVSDNSKMFADFSMTENNLLALIREYGAKDKVVKAMPEVLLELNDGSIYEHPGYIISISGVLDKSTGAAKVRSVFTNPDGLLHSGFSGVVLRKTRFDSVLVVPQSATFEIQDKVFVYKVVDSCAKSVPVKITRVDGGENCLVTEGLEVGDVIIAKGAGLVREGTRVIASKKEE